MGKKITDDFGALLCPKCGSEYTHILSVDVVSSCGNDTITKVSGHRINVSPIDHCDGGADAIVRISCYCEKCGSIDCDFDDKNFEKALREHVCSECFYIEFNHHEGHTSLEIK